MAKGIYIGELSERYTEVEYLQSSGTQYIDTGYKPGGNTRVICEFTRIANSPTANYGAALFGVRKAKNSYDYTFWGFNHLDDKLTDNYYSTDKHITFPGTERVVVDKNKNVTTVNNNSSYSVTHTYTNFTSSYNLYIFATNKAGSPDTMQMGTIRVYYLKIYDNGVLVRDFIPAVNLKGTYGFFDKVNSKFYTNKGSGTFTIGLNTNKILYQKEVARKIKKIYMGINNVAQKMKKAYIGINGIARLWWKKDEVQYYGTATPLKEDRNTMDAATIGKYAIIAGGKVPSDSTNIVEAYSSSLVKSNLSSLSSAKSEMGSASIGKYALFAGGWTQGSSSTTYHTSVDTYNTSLTKGTASALGIKSACLAGASVKDYALLAGGCYKQSSTLKNNSTVNTYNTSLTKGSATGLSSARYDLTGNSVGNYALFAGGYVSGPVSTVDAYDNSLTKIAPASLSRAKYNFPSAKVGKYVLFAGGQNDNNIVDAYDTSLTRTSPTVLSKARCQLAGASLEDFALFAGGDTWGGFGTAIVEIYDTSLTMTLGPNLSEERYNLTGASVGEYALFIGGSPFSTVVDVYTQ